jgi:hypothetical protein
MMRIVSLILVFVLFEVACSQKVNDNTSSHPLNWLIGTWVNTSNNEITFEKWTLLNDSTLTGISFSVNNSDTIVFENITIEKRGNEMYYIPKVKNQNQGEAVYFRFIERKNDAFVFENTIHDFPQRITYAHINTDSLKATIEGIIDNHHKQIDFYMSKIKGE